jgi:DNA-binding MarR family transcriptional regulator
MKTREAVTQHEKEFRQVFEAWGVDDLRGIELVRLLSATTRLLELIADHHLQAKGLSLPRLRLLISLHVAEQCGDKQGVSPSHLSHFQHISKNTVSALLKSLEDQGLIERALCDEDKRKFSIRLSRAGRTLVRSTLPNHSASMSTAFSALTAQEQETLIRLLHKLRQTLQEKASADLVSVHNRS